MNTLDLKQAREAVVRAHVDSENRHHFDETVATFEHPRYEVVPTGEVHDGSSAVRTFLEETYAAFPNMHIETVSMHHSDDAIIVEAVFHGTHTGPWRGLPSTGRRISYRMCNVFVFEGSNLVCERLYFDLLTALMGLGIARDPTSTLGRIATILNHPITMTRALLRGLRQ